MEGVCKRPFHVWHVLLIACCDCCLVVAALILTNTEPQKSQMSNYGSEISSTYRKPMLGTQRDVTADRTSFDNNGLLVLVYNRTKTKSKDQVSKRTLRAQHLCGPGGNSRENHGIPSSTKQGKSEYLPPP